MKPVRVLGHSIHPMVTDFPMALWMTSILWDFVRLWRNDQLWSAMAFWTLLLGIVAAIPAALSGFLEYVSIPVGHKAGKKAVWHMVIMLFGGCFFTVSLIVRRVPDLLTGAQMWLALALSVAGALFVFIGGWFGGELMAHFGLGTEFFKESDQ